MNEIKILSVNIRSLLPKKEELKNYCIKNRVDIINIQESWINKNKRDPIISQYQTITNKNENEKGSGLVTFISNKLKYKILNISNTKDLFVNKKKMSIGNIYIHPGYNPAKITRINDILEKIPRIDLLTGDFNAHNRNWSPKSNRMGTIVDFRTN